MKNDNQTSNELENDLFQARHADLLEAIASELFPAASERGLERDTAGASPERESELVSRKHSAQRIARTLKWPSGFPQRLHGFMVHP